jgi:hypothetical protein
MDGGIWSLQQSMVKTLKAFDSWHADVEYSFVTYVTDGWLSEFWLQLMVKDGGQ